MRHATTATERKAPTDQAPTDQAPTDQAPTDQATGDQATGDQATTRDQAGNDVLVSVSDLVVTHPVGGGEVVHAVSGISFDLYRGETLGLVGESGCGKSTTGRALLCLPAPTAGSVVVEGCELTTLSATALRAKRPTMQLIFQDPLSSLNPHRSVADVVAEPLAIWKRGTKAERAAKVAELLEAVGLPPASFAARKGYELSGGQAQRVSIARALALEPTLLVCDEPVSALDVSVQAQILNLLEDLKARYGLTMVFISHDLSVIRHVSDRICVMYLGKLCELGPRDPVYDTPRHPYTAALVASVPHPDPMLAPTPPPLVGELPSAVHPPSGCRFHTRCPRATARCTEVAPPLAPLAGGDPDHLVACHHPLSPEEGLGGTPTPVVLSGGGEGGSSGSPKEKSVPLKPKAGPARRGVRDSELPTWCERGGG